MRLRLTKWQISGAVAALAAAGLIGGTSAVHRKYYSRSGKRKIPIEMEESDIPTQETSSSDTPET